MSSTSGTHDNLDNINVSQPFLAPKQASTNVSSGGMMNLGTDEKILNELRQLNSVLRIQAELAVEEPLKTQAIWNFLLQAFGLVVGTLFGVFAILAWKAATEANNMANSANQIALAGYCQSQTNDICYSIQSAASSSVLSYAAAFYDITPNGQGYSSASTSVSTGVTTSTSTFAVTSTSSTDANGEPGTSTFVSSGTASEVITTSSTTTLGATPTSAPTSGKAPGTSLSSHAGAIAGGVIGGVVGLTLLGCLPWLTFRSRKRRYDDFAPMVFAPEANQNYGR